jgi:hypothetical protein
MLEAMMGVKETWYKRQDSRRIPAGHDGLLIIKKQ